MWRNECKDVNKAKKAEHLNINTELKTVGRILIVIKGEIEWISKGSQLNAQYFLWNNSSLEIGESKYFSFQMSFIVITQDNISGYDTHESVEVSIKKIDNDCFNVVFHFNGSPALRKIKWREKLCKNNFKLSLDLAITKLQQILYEHLQSINGSEFHAFYYT